MARLRLASSRASLTTFALFACCAASPAFAAERIDVYRCAGEDGGVSLQDQPCPPGSDETYRQLRRPADAPTPIRAEPAVEPEHEQIPDPAPVFTPRSVMPPLFQCVDFDGSQRESSDGIPRGRYVPLWVVGRDPYAPRQLFGRVGAPLPQPGVRPPAGPQTTQEQPTATGLPLVYVEERCYRLSFDQACERYAAQRRELERKIFNSQASDRAILQPQSNALRLLLAEHCGR